jgi:iron complex outermembrane recepter protein
MRIATIFAVALLGTACLADVEHAQAAIKQYQLNIPRQSLDMALKDLAQQTGLQIGRFSDRIDGSAVVGPVEGVQTPAEALGILLEHTGLSYKIVSETMFAIYNPKVVSSTRQLDGKGGKPVPTQMLVSTAAIDGGSPVQKSEGNAGLTEQLPNSQPRLEEVTVTAQKREERLQDVPVPVTAVSGQSLIENNQVQLQDYYTQVPGLSLSPSPDGSGAPSLAIRGLATGGYTNPTVGITIDDVPYGSSTGLGGGFSAPDLDPSDLARIEVLRGPQGTLYGASSIGGLLKFVTVDPSTDLLSGRVEGGISSTSHGSGVGYALRGAVNVPISDDLAIRASAFDRRDPGYIDNVVTGVNGINQTDNYGGHLSALWRIADGVSLKLSGLVQHSDADGSALVAPALGDLRQDIVQGGGGFEKTIQGYSAKLAAKLGNADLTVLSGYNINKLTNRSDYTQVLGSFTETQFGVLGTPSTNVQSTKTFTQEVRLSVPIGPSLDWLIGAFYMHQDSTSVTQIFASDPTSGRVVGLWLDPDSFPTAYAEYAAFSDLTWRITDRLDVQLGGRESQNRQTYNEIIAGPYDSTFIGLPSPIINPETHTKDHSFTYLVTPRLKLSPDLMLYARFASGYRTGGPNPVSAVFSLPTSYKPDTTQNAEVGLKGNFLEHKLSLDMSIYHIDWKDIQIQLVDPRSEQGYYANGSRAKSEGVELSLGSTPLRGLTLSSWVVWNHSVLTESFPEGSSVYGGPGDRLPYASRLSGNVSADWQFPLTSQLSGFIGGQLSYVGNREGVFTGTPLRQSYGGYALMEARAGVRLESWSVNLSLDNIADRRGTLGGGLGSTLPTEFVYVRPRTVALSLTRTF